MRNARKMGLAAIILTLLIGCSEKDGQAPAQERVIATGDNLPVNSITVSPDGTMFATAHGVRTEAIFERGYVAIWDIKSGKKLAKSSRLGSVDSVAFSPDGKTIA